MKIRKNDQVLIIKGKDKGKKGKVLRGFPEKSQVLVEKINMRKVHKRPKKSGEKGQIVELAFPINIANVKLICPNCAKPTRISYQIKEDKREAESLKDKAVKKTKIRFCKKCEKEI
jgi:large subunit ribosomal protein L24